MKSSEEVDRQLHALNELRPWRPASLANHFAWTYTLTGGLLQGARTHNVIGPEYTTPFWYWLTLLVSILIPIGTALAGMVTVWRRKALLVADIQRQRDASIKELVDTRNRIEYWYGRYKQVSLEFRSASKSLEYFLILLTHLEVTDESRNRISRLIAIWEDEHAEDHESA